jgi:hypothetical protein
MAKRIRANYDEKTRPIIVKYDPLGRPVHVFSSEVD